MKLIDCTLCYLAVRDLYTYKNEVVGSHVNLKNFQRYVIFGGEGGWAPPPKLRGAHPLNIREG